MAVPYPDLSIDMSHLDAEPIMLGQPSAIAGAIRDRLAKGELDAAIALHEEDDGRHAGELITLARTESADVQRRYADMFRRARDFRSAAAVLESAKAIREAATLYEQAADFSSSGRCWEAAGDISRAAAAWGKSGEVDRALSLHSRLGPTEAMAELLARIGRTAEAADVYRQLGHVAGELAILQLVPMDDPGRIEATMRAAELLRSEGRSDEAIPILVDTIKQSREGRRDRRTAVLLISVLEELGRPEHADQVRRHLEKISADASPEKPPAVAAPRPTFSQTVLPDKPAASAAPIHPALRGREPLPTVSRLEPVGATPAGPMSPIITARDGYAKLKEIPLFGQLAIDDMRELFRLAREIRFRDEQVVIEQGVPGKGLFVIIAGGVRVVRVDPRGEAVTVARRGPGECVGEMSLIEEQPTVARVVAAGEAAMLFISRERFLVFLESHEAAALRIYRHFTTSLSERLREATTRG